MFLSTITNLYYVLQQADFVYVKKTHLAIVLQNLLKLASKAMDRNISITRYDYVRYRS